MEGKYVRVLSRDDMIYKQFFQLIPSSQFQSQVKTDGISPHSDKD